MSESATKNEIDQVIERAYQLYFEGDFDGMEKLVEQALGQYTRLNGSGACSHSLAAIRMVQAYLNIEFGYPGDSLSLCLDAINLLDDDDDAVLRIRTLNLIAYVYYLSSQLAPALEYARQALELCEELDLSIERVTVLNTLSGIYLELKDFRSGMRSSKEAIHLLESLDSDAQKVRCLYNYSICCMGIRRVVQAKEALHTAIEISQRKGINVIACSAQAALGVIAFDEQQTEEARDLLNSAINGFSRMRISPRLAEYYSILGTINLTLGDLPQAKQAFERALEISEYFDLQLRRFYIFLSLSQYYEAIGDQAGAVHALKTAYASEKLSMLHRGQLKYTTISLKYPSLSGRQSPNRETVLKKALTLDSTSGLLNSISFISLGNRYFQKFKEQVPDCQLLILSINGGLDQNTLEPQDLAGDTLRMVIEALGKFVRLSDLVSRLPGGYFLVLMPHISQTEAQAVIEKIQAFFRFTDDEAFLLQYLDLHIFSFQPEACDRSFTHFVNRSLLKIL